MLDAVIFTPTRLQEAASEAGRAAIEAVEDWETYEALKEVSEDVLSEIKTGIERGDRISESRLERLARCTGRWRAHVRGVAAARHKAVRSRVEAKNAERMWSTIQSALSFMREGIKRDVYE